MAEKRKDSKGRVLRENEMQRDNGLYIYSYVDIYGNRKQVSSWKLVPTDKIPNGKRNCVSLREKEEIVLEDNRKGIDISAKNKMSLNDMFDKYMEGKSELKDSTRGNYIYMYDKYVRTKFGKRKIADIKYSDVKAFYNGLLNGIGTSRTDGFKPNSLEIIHTIIHPVFTLAVRDDIISKNPSDGVMAEIKKSNKWEKTKRHALTEEEQRLFMDFVDNSEVYKHWAPLFTFFLGTGCRVGEGIGLTWKDIDFKNNTININHNLIYRKQIESGACEMHITTPKTKAGTRTIPMLREVKEALLQIKKEQMRCGVNNIKIDEYSGFVFLNRFGDVSTPYSINRAIERIRLTCNEKEKEQAEKEHRKPVIIPHFSIHNLRHTFCTRYCENETNIKVIQEIMGHSDISTTMNIYAEATEAKKKESMANMDDKIFIRSRKAVG